MGFKNLLWILTIAVSLVSCQSGNKYQKIENGVIVKLPKSFVKLEFYSAKTVRITESPTSDFSSRKSLAVNKFPENVKWDIESNKDELTLSTNEFSLQINPTNGNCLFYDADGNSYLHAMDRNLDPDTVMGEDVYHASQKFKLSEDEGIYGLGQHQDGIMNWRGHEVTLIQTNVHAVNPF